MFLRGYMLRCPDTIRSWSLINFISEKGTRSVKQASRNFRPQGEVQIKHEIHDLLDVRSIKVVLVHDL